MGFVLNLKDLCGPETYAHETNRLATQKYESCVENIDFFP
jgi:hypothetical protein